MFAISDSYSKDDVLYEWLTEDGTDDANLTASVDISDDIRLSQYALLSWEATSKTKESNRIGKISDSTINYSLCRKIVLIDSVSFLKCMF